MKYLSILVKPVSGNCNIDCKYCFYKELVSEKGDTSNVMKKEVMTALIDKAIASGSDEVMFAFQGGEPLLAGEQYYEEFVQYVNMVKGAVKVSYSIQTNGMLVSDWYIKIFKENDFLIGVSLDGPKYIHDAVRVTYQGKPTFETVISNTKRLMAAGIRVNVLTVITNSSAARAGKLYEFYKKNHFEFLQFIPCMDSIGICQGSAADSLDNKNYLMFLNAWFIRWYEDLMSGEYISIRHFDNWIRIAIGQPVDTCSLAGQCGSYYVVEREGDVFPCDFYVMDQWCLGNILDNSFEELRDRLIKSGFLQESKIQLSEKCKVCANRDLCRGGCKRDWVYDDAQGRTRYCEALDSFFSENRLKISQIARLFRNYQG